MKFKSECTPGQLIADGWGDRLALKTEEEIKRLEAELAANDVRFESGEMDYDEWKRVQDELREKIKVRHKIIQKQKAKFDKLLAERRAA